jgi:hypothetical protein
MTRSSPRLCVASHCHIPRHHTPDCPDWDACAGCQPARADDGLLLCIRCTTRLGQDAERAGRIYAELANSLIRSGVGGEHRGSSTGAPVPDDAVADAREDLWDALVTLARRISHERGVTMPPARVAMGAVRIATRFDGSTVLDRNGQPVTRTVVRPSTALESVSAFVSLHAGWLAAQPDAGKIADQLHDLGRPGGEPWRLAYPSRATRLYIGDCPVTLADLDGNQSTCGERIYLEPDQPLITCPGCEMQETVEQWQRWIVGEHGGQVDAYAAAADLSMRWCRPVDPALLRQWAHRARGAGRELMVLELDPDDPAGIRHRPVRDEKRRVLYDLATVWQEARRMWGDQPNVGRRLA